MAGAALDPELILFGVHSQLGPIFHRDAFFRPNAEFAFGEVTDLIALNLEGIYRLPISSRQGGGQHTSAQGRASLSSTRISNAMQAKAGTSTSATSISIRASIS